MNNPALMECPACKAQVSRQATSCPNCGQPRKKKRPLLAGCLGLLLLGAVAGIIGSLFNPQSNSNKTNQTPPSNQAASSASNSNAKASNTGQVAAVALDEDVAGIVIKRYLSETLNDPNSLQDFEVLSITPAKKVPGVYKVVVSYRASNGFGALILKRQGFVLSKGTGHVFGWDAMPVKD